MMNALLSRSRRWAAVGAVLVGALVSVAVPASASVPVSDGLDDDSDVSVSARAAGPRPLFQMPFPCGERWRIQTYPGHDDYDIDMFAADGETNNRPIVASYAGTVVRSGWDNGGGNYVRLDHGQGWQTLYLHMIAPPSVEVGERVEQGDVLGRVGSTGRSSAPHLHFEQKINGAKTESYFNGVASGITDDGSSAARTVTSKNGCNEQPPPPQPDPHGPVHDRARTAAGAWAASTTRVDANSAIEGIAAASLPNGSMHLLTVVPGSGLYHRQAWQENATRIDTNPAISATAAAALPDGTLHAFALVPGSGVWHRVRSANGTWAPNATQVDGNGAISALSATGLPNGRLHLQVVTPVGVFDRARSASGDWADQSTRFDMNEAITAVASAALPDGTLHIFAVVPGSGVWHRQAWQENATLVDANPSVVAVSAAGLRNGTLQLSVAVDGSGVWHRQRATTGAWEAGSTRVDTNGRVFGTYTVGLPDNTVHLGTNPDVS